MQAYRQRVSSSVQIARIAAVTIIVSSFILGSFILASSWVAARASCHQLEQLDAMLDKELALEGRSYGNDGLIAVSTLISLEATFTVLAKLSAPFVTMQTLWRFPMKITHVVILCFLYLFHLFWYNKEVIKTPRYSYVCNLHMFIHITSFIVSLAKKIFYF